MSEISFQYVISIKTLNGIIYILFHIKSLKVGMSQFELATSQVLNCHMWLMTTILNCVVLDNSASFLRIMAELHAYPRELINV